MLMNNSDHKHYAYCIITVQEYGIKVFINNLNRS
jgi:hypothetical protein